MWLSMEQGNHLKETTNNNSFNPNAHSRKKLYFSSPFKNSTYLVVNSLLSGVGTMLPLNIFLWGE
jgi:hypothetical protein